MKALDEYFLMVVFMLLLNKVHVFATFIFNLDREKITRKRGFLNERELCWQIITVKDYFNSVVVTSVI